MTNGAACPDDGLSCTSDVCQAGACTHPLQANACLIGGACQAAGASEPGVDCQSCQPAQSTTAWSPSPNGGACASDGISCHQAVCAAGTCSHPIAAGSCYIAGNCVAAGAANPFNPCQTCQPGVSTSAWSNAVDGTSCNGGGPSCTVAACMSGTCTQTLLPNNCLIAGTCVAAGTTDPLADCQVCQPALSTTAWSPSPNGTACTSDGIACTVDACTAGACTHALNPETCLIGGTCVAEGTQDPANDCASCQSAVSTTGWSTSPDGAPCTSDGLSCTSDVCHGGTCTHPQSSGTCLVAGVCYAPGASDPADSCQACSPTSSMTTWTAIPGCVVDAGAGDAGPADAGPGDAGSDAGNDAGSDAGPDDAGTSDAGDGGLGDAGNDAGDDAGTSDAGDGGLGDAGSDAGSDAGPADAGSGGAGGSGGADAGTGGTGGMDAGTTRDAGSGGSSGTGGDATGANPSKPSGCNCRLEATEERGATLPLAAFAAALVLSRRRKGARAASRGRAG